MEIRQLTPAEARQNLSALAHVLVDCVDGGASVSFMGGFSQKDAEAFFAKVIEGVERAERILLAAFLGTDLIGTVQVVLNMPPNQPHRGEIAKLLVIRSARGKGIGRRLMRQAEEASRVAGKWLLILDTADAHAEKLYTSLGWTRLGVVPDYALLPNGDFCPSTFFWKNLLAASSGSR